MVGYDRPLDNYFAQVYDAAGEVVFWLPGTTDLAHFREAIEPYLDTRKLGLHDVSTAVFIERLGEHLNPGSHPAHKVEDWRDLPVRNDEAQAQDIAEPILTPEERQSVRDFVRARNASPEWQLAEILADALDHEDDSRCLECGAYGGHAERCSLSPEVQSEEFARAEAARRAEAAFLRENPDLEEDLSLSHEATEPILTAALAANAAEIARHSKQRQAQQRDRRVVGITADATGADRDRHGREFHAAEVEQAQPAAYRQHDAPRAVEIGEIRQAKATSIVGGDGKPYDLQAGRYAVVADETCDGRLQSAMIRYVVTDRTTGERHAALSPVSDDRLRTLVRDGSVELHRGFALEQLGQRQEVRHLAVERENRQRLQRSARVSLRR
ncbi:MAG: hypothetical protein WCE44_14690 [Candidatus Velthaea sp.]